MPRSAAPPPSGSGHGSIWETTEESLYEAAGRRPFEQRALILLGVIGLALAVVLLAYFLGSGLRAEEPPSVAEHGDSGVTVRDPANLEQGALGVSAESAKDGQQGNEK